MLDADARSVEVTLEGLALTITICVEIGPKAVGSSEIDEFGGIRCRRQVS
jgi:hypothetical protein